MCLMKWDFGRKMEKRLKELSNPGEIGASHHTPTSELLWLRPSLAEAAEGRVILDLTDNS